MNSSKDALLTEHFRYTPLSLIDDIINSVNTVIYRAIQATESGLLSAPPPVLGFGFGSTSSKDADFAIRDVDDAGNEDYPEAREEIENGVHQLETLLESTVDKTFDRFEIYTLRNILTVPDELAPWIRLAHYENLPLLLPPTSPTPESILSLRRTLQESQKLNIALSATHAHNASLISSLKSLLTQPQPQPPPSPSSSIQTPHPSLAFLTSTSTSLPRISKTGTATATPLTTSAQFTASQLPALRALVAALKPQLEKLSTAERAAERGGGGRGEERRRYVEGVVERVVGEFGMMGDEGGGGGGGPGGKREGAWGGKRGIDELGDLEAMAGGAGEGEGGGAGGKI